MARGKVDITIELIPDGASWLVSVSHRGKHVLETTVEAATENQAYMRAIQTISMSVGDTTHTLAEWLMRYDK